jgi:hypothetical protein
VLAVHADPALLDTLRNPVEAFIKMLTGALARFVDGARNDIENELDRRLFNTVDLSVPGMRPLTTNPSLRRLNLSLAVAADVLLGAVVLFAALRSIFERSLRSHYSLKMMFPKLLLAIVLVHFSLPLMQMGIDLNNALCVTVLQLGNQMRVDGMPWSPSLAPDTVAHISATDDIFHGAFCLVVVVALVILVLAYVLRHALLQVLIVCAPIAALCTCLPETRGYARSWLRLFTVTVFMQAVQLLILRVATVVAVEGGGGLVQSLEALATLFLMLKVPGALNEAAHLETKAETLAKHFEKSARKSLAAPFHPPKTRRRTA